ncbi:hypothetical protein [Citricoccus sp.]|uniref:hypothetical protein n=1 Tax=Citricoccus sp. TaxID=1978372 RepID=UPI002623600C|nr:hypothetical protein [Citricoccus sp.]HRO31663.1 hypothetical protein [Citricoccus sp.]HRO95153.1 hypothetical protein [Citricoccus sp.]
MEHALRIGLRAETLPGPIRLDAAGCLTRANHARLLKLLDRAVCLKGCPSLTVNLVDLDHLEPGAWSALARHLAALERARAVPGQELLEVAPVIGVHTPTRPRYCTAPPAGTNVQDLGVEDLSLGHVPVSIDGGLSEGGL